MDNHLVVNVEEQIARRLYDRGHSKEAQQAVVRAESIPTGTPLDELEMFRLVPVSKQEQAEREKQTVVSAWENLRFDRDALLAASDWTQLPDIPEATRKAWAAYRKKLRDLPAKTKNPTEVSWPEAPA